MESPGEPETPAEVSRAALEADEALGRSLHLGFRGLAFGVVGVFATFVVLNATVRHGAYSSLELALDVAAGLGALAVALALGTYRGGPASHRRRDALSLVLAGLCIANVFLTATLAGHRASLTYLPFLILGASFVGLRWSVFLGVVAMATAAGLAAGAGGTHDELVDLLTHLAAGTVAGASLQAVRLAQARRIAQLRAQEASLQARLERSQRLEALGTLAGGVAHDMNNVLAAIAHTAEALRSRPDPQAVSDEDLNAIVEAADQGASLTRRLLAFARRSPPALRPVDVGQVVEGAVALLARTLPKEVVLRVDLEPELPEVTGDPGQLGHVLVNLAVNAADAMNGRGEIRVGARGVTLGHDPELGSGPFVEIRVADDGPGMDEATRARAFDPFFSTKAGEHSGLGLSMVFGTARQHGGDVRLRSEPGRGTEVRVLLPARVERRPAADDATATATGALDGLRVLVVDDEPLVRQAAKRLLRTLGVEATVAASGREALERYAPSAVDVVLLDLAMPELGGAETFRALRARDPDVRVVLASGYPKGADVRALLAEGVRGFLVKPYSKADLARALGEAREHATVPRSPAVAAARAAGVTAPSGPAR